MICSSFMPLLSELFLRDDWTSAIFGGCKCYLHANACIAFIYAWPKIMCCSANVLIRSTLQHLYLIITGLRLRRSR
jgi:hypothetical protein